MKRNLAIVTIVVLFIAFLSLVAGAYDKKAKAMTAAEKIATLPDFILPSINGEIFNSDLITSGPVLITYFHPECEHCRYEVTSLLNSRSAIRNLKILLISPANSFQVKSFFRRLELKEDSLYIVLCDTSLILRDIYNVDVYPSNYIYDKDLNLVKVLKGETMVEAIYKNLR